MNNEQTVNVICGIIRASQCDDETKENLIAFMRSSEWISVKDRLPEEGIDALVCRQSDSIGECVDMAYRQNGCWRGTADGWRLDDVTHWMPLPAPPTP